MIIRVCKTSEVDSQLRTGMIHDVEFEEYNDEVWRWDGAPELWS